jgi:glucose-1-phosphate cytidylyltransferase
MKVVILCGGQGTRLREETEHRPKPMLPIGNRPILWHIMRTYASFGHKEFILCLGYKGEMIKDWFRNLRWMTSDISFEIGSPEAALFHSETQEHGWKVTMADTGLDTMTGGRIKRIEKYLGDDDEFLLTYGDGVGRIDVSASIRYHQASKKLLTVTAVRPPGRWGELMIESGQVKAFLEKPQTSTGRINGGFFVASRGIFRYLNDDPGLVFEQEPLRAMSRDNQLAAFEHDGFWQPMDTYQEYLLLNRLWRENKAEWKIWL